MLDLNVASWDNPVFVAGSGSSCTPLLALSSWDGFKRGGVGVETANRPNGICKIPHFRSAAFLEACRILVDRHPILTGVIEERDGIPWLLTGRIKAADICIINGMAELDYDKGLRDVVWKPFDIFNGPLIRVFAFTNTSSGHYIGLVVHHLICDGTSVNILMQELRELYRACFRKEPASLPTAGVNFVDYCSTLARWNQSPNGLIARDHACEAVAGAGDWSLEGSIDPAFPDPEVFQIDPDVASRARRMARESRTTLFTLLLIAQAITLRRYCNSDRVPIKIITSGRDAPGLLRTVGNLADRVYALNDMSRHPSAREMIERAHASLRVSRRYAMVRSDILHADLHQRSISLTAPAFNFRAIKRTSRQAGKINMVGDSSGMGIPPPPGVLKRFPKDFYSLSIIDDGSDLSGTIRYSNGRLTSFLVELESEFLKLCNI